MNFIEKLNLLMERNNYNKNSLSKASGIPYTTIDNWYKRGYDNLQLPTVKKLCSFFHTSLDFWLKEDITDPDYGKTSGFKVSVQEAEFINKYRFISTNSPEGAKMVDTVLNREYSVAEQLNKQNEQINELEQTIAEKDLNNPGTRLINYYYRLASAGTGQIIFDTPPTKRIEIPDTPENQKAAYAIGVNGDSMEPVYHDGDTLLIEMTEEILPGDIGIFLVDDCCYVKKRGKNELISINKDSPNISLNESARCMGKVINKLNNDKRK